MFDNLILLSEGRLNLGVAGDSLDGEPEPRDVEVIGWMLSQPGTVFVTHTPPFELAQGAAERLRKIAASLDYQHKIESTIADFNGRPVFQVLSFVRSSTVEFSPAAR
jgi:hypothetical protein